MNTKKIKKLNIKVRVKQRPDLVNSETENSSPQMPVKVTGFERALSDSLSNKSDYWFITDDGDLGFEYETGFCTDDRLFETANYYTNENLANWCRRSDNLTRKMRRWAAEHNTETDRQRNYYLIYNKNSRMTEISCMYSSVVNNNVYFDTYETAVFAIAEFGNEIKWLAENRPKWF